MRTRRSNLAASDAWIRVHGNRVASTANGSVKLISSWVCARKKSAVTVSDSPRNRLCCKFNLMESTGKIHAEKLASVLTLAILQGRLNRRLLL